jgi:hypothetical protein
MMEEGKNCYDANEEFYETLRAIINGALLCYNTKIGKKADKTSIVQLLAWILEETENWYKAVDPSRNLNIHGR